MRDLPLASLCPRRCAVACMCKENVWSVTVPSYVSWVEGVLGEGEFAEWGGVLRSGVTVGVDG